MGLAWQGIEPFRLGLAHRCVCPGGAIRLVFLATAVRIARLEGFVCCSGICLAWLGRASYPSPWPTVSLCSLGKPCGLPQGADVLSVALRPVYSCLTGSMWAFRCVCRALEAGEST